MKAVIVLDVPDWQIGQDVTVYFPDTMVKHCKCELLKEQEAVKPEWFDGTPFFGNCGHRLEKKIRNTEIKCPTCGRLVKWNA